jgi:N-acetylglutamate synthase
MDVVPMTIADYDAVRTLWEGCEGIGLADGDERDAVGAFIQRNPGLSLVVRVRRQVIGAVMCGHDGRRGFIYHLAVDPGFRGRGIGREMVKRCLAGLGACGISKCAIHVFGANAEGRRFWEHLGWAHRADLVILQAGTPG